MSTWERGPDDLNHASEPVDAHNVVAVNHSSSSSRASRPLRIAVIGGRGVPSSYSGVERICEDMFAIFADRGHKVTVYCRPQVLAEKTGTYRGMRLVRTPAPGGKNGETLSHSLTSILHARAFGDADGEPFDILSLHTLAPNLWAPLGRLAGPKIITHVHGLDHQREKWKGMGARVIRLSERMMVRSAHQIVVVNPSLVDYYRDTYGVPSVMITNGIHAVPDSYTPDVSVLEKFGLQPGKYLVSVGRLVPEKRIQDTIAAFAQVDTDLKLVFVGEGKHSPYYEQQVKALGARDPRGRVVFTGQQSGNALESLFRSAKLYVSASDLEGMPSSVLECMERRIPAVLSDIPPHRALFEGIAGYDLDFQPGDVDALADRLRHAIANPHGSMVLADRAREMVRTYYSWPVLADKTETLYRHIANNQPALSLFIPEAAR
jgi:glycosyltransferase involved in cell wall biosynthesis